jgi:hypothetical protein
MLQPQTLIPQLYRVVPSITGGSHSLSLSLMYVINSTISDQSTWECKQRGGQTLWFLIECCASFMDSEKSVQYSYLGFTKYSAIGTHCKPYFQRQNMTF